MTRAKRLASRFRWIILIVGILYSLAAIGWLIVPFFSNLLPITNFDYGVIGTPFTLPIDFDKLQGYEAPAIGANGCLVIGMLLLAQWALLRPGRALGARLAIHAKPMKRAVIVAAFMAMLLTVGAISLEMELTDWWQLLPIDSAWSYILIIWGSMFALWTIWTIIFWIYWRQGDRYTQLGKMVRGLIAGSLVEAIIAIPLHVWATRQRGCYCDRGTYTTLILSGTVLFWAFGPGIVLLFMKEKYRQAKLFPMCTNCGYDLRGSGEVCSECGTKSEKYQRSRVEQSQ